MIARGTIFAPTLNTVLPSGAAFAVNTDTIICCSEASSKSFSSQIIGSDPPFVVNSQMLYDRSVSLGPVKNTPMPSLTTDWTISPDSKTYMFTPRQGTGLNSNKFFKPTRDFNTDGVIFSVLRQKGTGHPYHKVSRGSYEYFNDVDLDKLIKEVKKVDDFHAQFVLNEPNAVLLADWSMDLASILSVEYVDAVLRKGIPENVDNWPISIRLYVL